MTSYLTLTHETIHYIISLYKTHSGMECISFVEVVWFPAGVFRRYSTSGTCCHVSARSADHTLVPDGQAVTCGYESTEQEADSGTAPGV